MLLLWYVTEEETEAQPGQVTGIGSVHVNGLIMKASVCGLGSMLGIWSGSDLVCFDTKCLFLCSWENILLEISNLLLRRSLRGRTE